MNLKAIGICLSIFCFLNSSSLASDDSHLLPEDSIYSEFYPLSENDDLVERYEENVLKVFADVFDQDVFGRVIVYPSFQNEYAVALKHNESKYSLLVLDPTIHIWRFSLVEMYEAGEVKILGDDDGSQLAEELKELKQGLPEAPTDIPVETCEREISADLGEKLFFLWGDMLFRTRYPDKRPLRLERDDTIIVGADGTTYHFSFEYNYKRLAGQIWSPDADSVTGRFVTIARTLADACFEKGKIDVVELDKLVSELSAELSNAPY